MGIAELGGRSQYHRRFHRNWTGRWTSKYKIFIAITQWSACITPIIMSVGFSSYHPVGCVYNPSVLSCLTDRANTQLSITHTHSCSITHKYSTTHSWHYLTRPKCVRGYNPPGTFCTNTQYPQYPLGDKNNENPIQFQVNWALNEPNNLNNEDHGSLYVSRGTRTGLWNDLRSSKSISTVAVCCDNLKLEQSTAPLEGFREAVESRLRSVQRWYRTRFSDSRAVRFCQQANDICPALGFGTTTPLPGVPTTAAPMPNPTTPGVPTTLPPTTTTTKKPLTTLAPETTLAPSTTTPFLTTKKPVLLPISPPFSVPPRRPVDDIEKLPGIEQEFDDCPEPPVCPVCPPAKPAVVEKLPGAKYCDKQIEEAVQEALKNEAMVHATVEENEEIQSAIESDLELLGEASDGGGIPIEEGLVAKAKSIPSRISPVTKSAPKSVDDSSDESGKPKEQIPVTVVVSSYEAQEQLPLGATPTSLFNDKGYKDAKKLGLAAAFDLQAEHVNITRFAIIEQRRLFSEFRTRNLSTLLFTVKTEYELTAEDEEMAEQLVLKSKGEDFSDTLRTETQQAMMGSGSSMAGGFVMTSPKLAEPKIYKTLSSKSTKTNLQSGDSLDSTPTPATSSAPVLPWLVSVSFLLLALCEFSYILRLKKQLAAEKSERSSNSSSSGGGTGGSSSKTPRTFEVPSKMGATKMGATKMGAPVDPDHVAVRVVGSPTNSLSVAGGDVVEGETSIDPGTAGLQHSGREPQRSIDPGTAGLQHSGLEEGRRTGQEERRKERRQEERRKGEAGGEGRRKGARGKE